MRHETLSINELAVQKLKPGKLSSHGRKVMECLVGTVVKQVGAVTLGTLPKGAIIQKVEVGVRTAFNGTSAALNIGHATDADAYMATDKITEGTAGIYTYLPGVAALTAQTTVLATLTDADGTTGDATVIVFYTHS